jgi:NADPH:quinone reductase-like Zn-dependent oxidoreductase
VFLFVLIFKADTLFFAFRLTALQALSPHVSSESSVLVIGGSGGTGHVALQVARCLGASRVSTVCSGRNADFCHSCGATDIIDYTKSAKSTLEGLVKSPHKPFQVILDCVSSADPRDQRTDYPKLILSAEVAPQIITEDYVYRRLGGPSSDWIRAGLERSVGLRLWPNRHEKLFWIRFPKSADELHRLKEWCEAGKLQPQIAKVYDFTEEGVQDAFDAILGRRVQGKVVVKIRSESAIDE